jgi:hypothetical protein
MLPTLMRAVPWNMFTSFSYYQTPPLMCNHWTRASYIVWNKHIRGIGHVFLPLEIDRNVSAEDKKMEHFGCHSRYLYFQGVELLHVYSNSELMCAVLLWHCNFSHHQWWKLWMSQGHIICPSTFDEFLNVNKPLLLLVISWQVLTAQAPAACIW